QQVPYASQVLRWAGVAYLFWLAYEAWRGTNDVSEGEMAPSFWRGLTVNLLNPKAAMFYVAVLPLFLQPADVGLGPQLWLTALYVTIATAVHTGLVLGAASLRGLFVDGERLVLFRRAAAIMMGCVALWFAWETRH
ncbi:MAG: LysE family translocator, partial [Bosea sp. (in: a-proteobacteria)]